MEDQSVIYLFIKTRMSSRTEYVSCCFHKIVYGIGQEHVK
jgi:hypothetical protein